jgi:hypothetical protein
MIRVLYRWQLVSGTEDSFRRWWHEGTASIRRSQSGALGSTLLQSSDDPSSFVGIARWHSREDLEAFWSSGTLLVFDGATLISREIFEELDDLVVAPPSSDIGKDGVSRDQ